MDGTYGNGNYTALQEIPNNFTGGLYTQAADINGDIWPARSGPLMSF